MITVKIVNTLQIVKTILRRLAAETLIELMFTNMTRKKSIKHLTKKQFNIRIAKIANILTSSGGGPQPKCHNDINENSNL
jgi:hypothetical protein